MTTGDTVTFANVGPDQVTIRSYAAKPDSAPFANGEGYACPELQTVPSIPAGGSVEVRMTSTSYDCHYRNDETGADLGTIRVGTNYGGCASAR